MKFGEEPIETAEGAILVHSLRFGQALIKKGQILGRPELDIMAAADLKYVAVARLEPGDVGENEAARHVADALVGSHVIAGPASTGRVNLQALQSGLVMFQPHQIDGLNAVTENITLATLSLLAPVQAGQTIATVKIIPFAVTRADLMGCMTVAPAARIEVRPFRPLTAILIQTVDANLKSSVLDKTSTITADRLNKLGGRLASETRCQHNTSALVIAINDLLKQKADIGLIIGASAIVDRRDVIPSAIEQSGGRLERLGMPVDPGNLILIAEIAGKPILGLPGCARSRVRNGLDWVLERISVGLPIGRETVAHMGVGGLLIGRDGAAGQ